MINNADTPWPDELTPELLKQALTAAHAGLSIDAAEKAEQLFDISLWDSNPLA